MKRHPNFLFQVYPGYLAVLILLCNADSLLANSSTGPAPRQVIQGDSFQRGLAALQANRSLRFHETDNPELICYSKTTEDLSDVIVVIVNLDCVRAQTGWVELDLSSLGLDADQSFRVHDLLGQGEYLWHGSRNYVALTPFRILDTRAQTCVQCGPGGLAANQTRIVQITGVTGLSGGADQVPPTATAIVINVTAVASTTGGLLTIYPTGTALPRASSLNFGAGTATPNLVTVTLGQTSVTAAERDVNIYNPIGSLNVVADVEGYFLPAASSDPTGEVDARWRVRINTEVEPDL